MEMNSWTCGGDQDDGNMRDASLPLCDADVFRFRVLIA